MSKKSSEWKLCTIKQNFLLPKALVYYIAKNPPSPEVYNKLIRCCKYFWLKNPVITLKDLYLRDHDNYWDTEIINGFKEDRKFKIENLNKKLWILICLSVWDEKNHFLASSIIPRIYRCDLIELGLSYQSLSFNEFLKFTSSGALATLFLKETTVKNDDGTIVSIEKLIELLPTLRIFEFYILPYLKPEFRLVEREALGHVPFPPKM